MKKYFAFSALAMLLIQYSVLVLSIVGAFFVTWSIGWVLITMLFFYIYGIIGMSMMLHRFWSHKSFEFKNPYIQKFFTFISVVSGRGSPLAWVHIHRTHHTYSDTDKDPHRPDKFSFFSFKTTGIKDLKVFLIKDIMTKEHKIIHEYYLLFLVSWAVFLFLINPFLLYFAWVLPLCLNQISQDLWNYYSHVNVGYRNFETKDNSRNVIWLWPLILGESWHNNHHNSPKSSCTGVQSFELDPVSYLINIVKK